MPEHWSTRRQSRVRPCVVGACGPRASSPPPTPAVFEGRGGLIAASRMQSWLSRWCKSSPMISMAAGLPVVRPSQMRARLLPPQLAPAIPRRQTVIATLPLALGLMSIMVGQYPDGLICLAMALWMASRAASLPGELRGSAEEEQREGWRKLATGPCRSVRIATGSLTTGMRPSVPNAARDWSWCRLVAFR